MELVDSFVSKLGKLDIQLEGEYVFITDEHLNKYRYETSEYYIAIDVIIDEMVVKLYEK